MSSLAETSITPEEYLEAERRSETKHEYFNGHIYAMAGASLVQNILVANLLRVLGNQLEGNPCRPLASDQRVRVSETGLYTYPDISIVCGEVQLADEKMDTLLNPQVILEVLSSSTEAYDRGDKFAHYRRMESLQEYLLVSQDKARIDHFVRQGEEWTLREWSGLESIMELKSVECRVALSSIYDGIDFSALEKENTDNRQD